MSILHHDLTVSACLFFFPSVVEKATIETLSIDGIFCLSFCLSLLHRILPFLRLCLRRDTSAHIPGARAGHVAPSKCCGLLGDVVPG